MTLRQAFRQRRAELVEIGDVAQVVGEFDQVAEVGPLTGEEAFHVGEDLPGLARDVAGHLAVGGQRELTGEEEQRPMGHQGVTVRFGHGRNVPVRTQSLPFPQEMGLLSHGKSCAPLVVERACL